MLTPTIQDIKSQVSKVDDWLKKTRIRDLDAKFGAGTTFGFEGEHSTKEFKACIKELVKEVRLCIRAHAHFIHLSTRDERKNLSNELGALANSLETENYSIAVAHFEQIKPILRDFRVRGTTEARDELDQQINEAHRKVALLQGDLEEVKTHVEEAAEHGKNISEIVQQADASREQLQGQQTSMQDIQGQLRDQLRNVEELTAKIQSKDEIINHFIAKIEEGQRQLQVQQVATEEYEKKLQDYSEERERERKDNDDLIELSKQALEYTTAVGVSAAFTERYIEYKKQRSWLWVVGAGILLGAVPVLAVFWWYSTEELDFVSLIYRFAVVSAVFSGAYFCAAQYRKHKNVQEDYGYKAVLAKSLVGFLEKLPEDAKEVYLARVLSEIHKDPMRKMHEVDDTASDSLRSKLPSLKRRGEE